MDRFDIQHRPTRLSTVRVVQLLIAASIIAMFSIFSFELAHTKSLSTPECNTACLSHSQAGSVLTNVNKLKKIDNEPRPPAYPQFDSKFTLALSIAVVVFAVIGWVNWYSRRMLVSTQLRY